MCAFFTTLTIWGILEKFPRTGNVLNLHCCCAPGVPVIMRAADNVPGFGEFEPLLAMSAITS